MAKEWVPIEMLCTYEILSERLEAKLQTSDLKALDSECLAQGAGITYRLSSNHIMNVGSTGCVSLSFKTMPKIYNSVHCAILMPSIS